ncbi:hypothetical protein B0T14DRAFT_526567 [Immersiella caudata]|uniref:Uncharacterized protein n=1 Tax=Immersiella caudata TaxID=314043 RepID=A0AA40BU14_9PEZI|nr:hypothetical protein B0T14DRAFT_526567 [Immersiella caudata]
MSCCFRLLPLASRKSLIRLCGCVFSGSTQDSDHDHHSPEMHRHACFPLTQQQCRSAA